MVIPCNYIKLKFVQFIFFIYEIVVFETLLLATFHRNCMAHVQ